nr:hypothetical protein [Tanacetum cinerariifolium]
MMHPEIHLSSQETSDKVFQANHSIQNEESFENPSDEIAVSSSNPEEPLQDSDIRQLIREECCAKVSEEQKQSMEDTMIELVKICQEKEFLCIHDDIDDLIESAHNSKLLLINSNSQHLDKKEHEVKNVVEQPIRRGNRNIQSLQNFRVVHKSSISSNTSQISSIHAVTPILSTKEPEHLLSMGYEHLSITPETESDEVTESNAENLLQIPSKCKYPDVHPPFQEKNEEVSQASEDLMKSIETYLEKFNCIPFEEKPLILLQAWFKFFAIQYSKLENPNELFQKLLEDLKELAEYENSQSRDRPIFPNDDENHSDQNKKSLENSSKEIAISSSNPEKEEPPQDSDFHQLIEECCVEASEEQKQSMEDTMLELVKICQEKEFLCRHDNVEDLIESALNTKLLSINSQRLDKKEHEVKNVIEQPVERGNRSIQSLQDFRVVHKNSISLNNTSQISSIHASNAENLLPIPSECEVTSEDKNIEYVEASLSYPEIVSVEEENVVQQEEEEVDLEDISQIQDIVLREKLLSITHLISNIESLNGNYTPDQTRNGNTTHADNSFPEYDSFCFEIEPDLERLINLVKNDIFDDSSNDPLLEEADLFLASDNSIPTGIENVANDSEGNVRFLEELLIDDSILSHESSDSNFEDNPSILRPPSEPPDAETDAGEEIPVVMNDKDKFDEDYHFSCLIRIEAIRLFLACASFMGFIVYQMDVKSAILYGTIEEEVYVCQPPGFEDPRFPNKTTSTPIETDKAFLKDKEAQDVDVYLYRLMIGSLMYLTASRPDIMFAVYVYVRFQVTPKVSHLHAVKRIFRYLKDSNYAGANLDRKSTIRGCQFLGKRLISWQCKKKTVVADSIAEVKYVAAAMKNPVFHSKTNEIEIRHHFIRDSYEKKLIQDSAKIKTVNEDVQIQDLTDRKKIIVTEASIKRDLQLQDAEAPKEVGEGSEVPTDTHHTPIVYQPSSSQPQKKQTSRRKQRKETEVPHTEPQTEERVPTTSNDLLTSGEDKMKLTELMNLCTNLQKPVLNLEKAKTAQAKEIVALKKRVKKLEKKKKSRTLGDQEDASKQERMTDNIDQDEEIALSIKVAEKEVSTADPVTTAGEVTLIEIKATKPKARGVIVQEPSKFRTTTSSQQSQLQQAKDKGKRIMVEPEKPLKKKDQIALDEVVARKLKAKMKAEMEEEERIAREKDEANMVVIEQKSKAVYGTLGEEKEILCKKIVEERSKKTQAEVTEGSSKRAGDELEQKSAKRQNLEKEDDSIELKRCLKIVSEDDDDVTIEATPLSLKSPTIVDYKIYKEGKKSYFKIIREDGNSQSHLTFV